MGRSGVVASLVAASERLHVNERKVCILVVLSTICRSVYSCVFEILNLLLLKPNFMSTMISSKLKSKWCYLHFVSYFYIILFFILAKTLMAYFLNLGQCCEVLAEAVCPVDDSPKGIVPRLMFLDSCFTFEDKSNWSWQSGARMNVMGSLILQTVFRFRSVSEFLEN